MGQRYGGQRYGGQRYGIWGHGPSRLLLAGLMLPLATGAGLCARALPALASPTTIPTPTALPPAEDLPEEVLVQEVILDGRSPLDGSPLSPEDYAALEAELGEYPEGSVAVSAELQSLLAQLKLLKLLRDIVPFW